MLRIIALIIGSLTITNVSAEPIDHYQILNHLDNYGNLYLRNKPYTALPTGLVVDGNLNIENTPITRLPKGLDVNGSLKASNSQLTRVASGVKIKGYNTDKS